MLDCHSLPLSRWESKFIPLATRCVTCGLVCMPYSHDGNGNIVRVTGHLCGEFTGAQKGQWRRALPGVFVDERLNMRLRKQSWGWWFETPSRQLWRHCNVTRSIFVNKRAEILYAFQLNMSFFFLLHVIGFREKNIDCLFKYMHCNSFQISNG